MSQLTREAADYINAQFEAGLISVTECTQAMLEIGVTWYYIKRDVR